MIHKPIPLLFTALYSMVPLWSGDPIHYEVPDMPPAPQRVMETSPARVWTRGQFKSVQVNVDAEGNNIIGDAANEPSIAADADHQNIVIGWRQFDSIASNFRQAGMARSSNGGVSWTNEGPLDPGVFRSDPVLATDSQGNFYYNGLGVDTGPLFFCTVWKSTNGGEDWGPGVDAQGGDKQWMEIDKTGGMGDGHIYSNWTWGFAACEGDFTVSFDEGQTYEDCVTMPAMPRHGTVTVDKEGSVYVGGAPFNIAKSTTLKDSSLTPAFDFAINVNMGGTQASTTGPNPAGLLGQVYVATDRTDGPSGGNVYMLASVDPPGSDGADVMLIRSTNGGVTWSAPIRVNSDPSGNWNWFGMMDVAPNGRIDVLWNDTREAPQGTFHSVLYYTYSEDQGETWRDEVPVTPAFDPHLGWPQQNKIGDYYDLVSRDEGVDLTYAATFNGEQDVYFMRISLTPCLLDVNGDGEVTELDWRQAAAAWGLSGNGDVDESGLVDLRDLVSIINGLGPCP